jgi:hypothetical protein
MVHQNSILSLYQNDRILHVAIFLLNMVLEALTSQRFGLRFFYKRNHDAFNYIRLGHADVMVTGGSEAAVTIAGMVNAMHALSTRNDDPKQLPDQWTKTEMDLY